MYGVGRKALPRSVKLWYYMRPFFLNSAVAAIFAGRLFDAGFTLNFFSWEGARNVRALSVRFGSEGSILIEIYLSWPFIRRLQRHPKGRLFAGLWPRFIISPPCLHPFPGGFGVLCFRRGTLKYIIAPHTLSEQDQAEGHDRHAAHHAVDRDVASPYSRAAGSSSSIEMKTMIPATPARMQPIMTGDMNGMRIK